jgi:hypothetical protein
MRYSRTACHSAQALRSKGCSCDCFALFFRPLIRGGYTQERLFDRRAWHVDVVHASHTHAVGPSQLVAVLLGERPRPWAIEGMERTSELWTATFVSLVTSFHSNTHPSRFPSAPSARLFDALLHIRRVLAVRGQPAAEVLGWRLHMDTRASTHPFTGRQSHRI